MTTTTSSLSGTGNQAYTPQRVDYLASYLQTQLPGLTHAAAVQWINAEQGANGNVLGLKDSSGRFYTYSSQEAGLRAAASWVKTAPAWTGYPGIVTSLATGDTRAQLRAIAASKWNGSHYPAWGFQISSPSTLAHGADLTAFGGAVSFPWGHVFTQADIETVITKLDASGQFASYDPVSREIAYNLIRGALHDTLVGKPWNATNIATLSARLKLDSGQSKVALPDPLAAAASVAQTFSDVFVFAADFENIRYGLALIIGVPLALFGFYLLAGVSTGEPT